MTSKQKLKKAQELIQEVLLEGDIVDDNNNLEMVDHILDDVIESN